MTTVTAGETVTINNVSGTVNFDTTDLMVMCVYTVNADGMARATYDSGQTTCYPTDWCTPDPVAGVAHAALYRLFAGTTGIVGTAGSSFVASTTGMLSLAVNDCSPTNNFGSFAARVTITP